MNFLALSQVPPALLSTVAIRMPPIVPTIRNAAVASALQDQADHDREQHREHAWRDHLAQRGAGGDVDAAGVVRLDSVPSMMPGFSRNCRRTSSMIVAGCLTDGADGQRAEEEDQHRAEEPADEHLDLRKVDREAWTLGP